MNQKGFAITSVIYGLSVLGIMVVAILMGTLSATRHNVSEEAKAVEEFLINYNQTEVTYRGTGSYSYKIPNGETGWYRFEALGKSNDTAAGAYTTGIIYADAGDVFNINITNQKTTISYYATEIMRAMAANGSNAGGNMMCYHGTTAGGNVNMTSFASSSTTYTGIDSINLDTSCEASMIMGYPGSAPAGDYERFFFDGLILAGASGTKEGKVIIQRVAEKDEWLIWDAPVKNEKFKNVTKISVNSTIPVDKIWYSYKTVSNDGEKDVYTGHTKSCSNPCTVSGVELIDDITIKFAAGNEKKNATNTTVTLNDSRIIYQAADDYGVTIGGNGLHFSAYQQDSYTSDILGSTNSFPEHGNYYLIPVNTDGYIVSGVSTGADDANKLQVEHITGEARQKWAIDKINGPGEAITNFKNIPNTSGRKEYRIMELTRFKALNIYYDENYKLNFVSASETFNSLSRNDPQIWNIFPMKDGTYAIKTVVPSFSKFEKSGFLFAKPSGEGPNNQYDVMIGLAKDQDAEEKNTTPTNVERFYLYSLDFSK